MVVSDAAAYGETTGGCVSCANPGSSVTTGHQFVYAIGQPGCDLVNESRRNSLTQHMSEDQYADNPAHLLDFGDCAVLLHPVCSGQTDLRTAILAARRGL